MASSKEKAVGLKDAYVAGLLDSAGPEVAAEAGAGALQDLAGKLGMEQGQQSSIHINMDDGIRTHVNDGDPRRYHTYRGNTFQTGKHNVNAYSTDDPSGRSSSRMTPGDKASNLRELQRLRDHHGLDLDTGMVNKPKKLFGIF